MIVGNFWCQIQLRLVIRETALLTSPVPKHSHRMQRTTYPAIQQFFNASNPATPFFIASFVGLLFILLPTMLRRRNKFPVNGRVTPTPEPVTDKQLVVITGGSQGLGEAMGVEFAKKGADIVLVSRSAEKLKIALQKVEVRAVIFTLDQCRLPVYPQSRNSDFTLRI
jgi:hypothetical protein